MLQLIKETKVWMVGSEDDAMELIQEKKDNAGKEGYIVTKSSYVLKTKKQKGEIVDSWVEVSITFTYDF